MEHHNGGKRTVDGPAKTVLEGGAVEKRREEFRASWAQMPGYGVGQYKTWFQIGSKPNPLGPNRCAAPLYNMPLTILNWV